MFNVLCSLLKVKKKEKTITIPWSLEGVFGVIDKDPLQTLLQCGSDMDFKEKNIYIITTLKPINKTNNNLIYNYALQRNAADPFRSLNLCIFAIFIWKDLREKVKPPIWSALET